MKGWFKSRRFFMQVLAITVVVLVVLCTMFITFLYKHATKSISDTIFHTESERTSDLLRQSNIYWQQLFSLGSSYISISIPYDDLSGADHYWTQKMFENMVASHKRSNPYISNIDIEIDRTSLSPSQISHDRQLDNLFYFEVYTSSDVVWPYSFDLQPKPESRTSPVVFTVDGYHLSKQLFTYSPQERLDYLLTPSGTILLTNQNSSYFTKIEETLPGIIFPNAEDTQISIREYDQYYYVFSEPDKYGFRVLSLVPQTFYAQQQSSLLSQTLLISVFMLLVALSISVFLTVRFYGPIKSTVDLLLTYIPDDIHEYENEIAFIHQNIAKYVSTPKHADSTVSEAFSRIQSAQTAVLQHQINSHFLFNTLENIKAVSIIRLGIDNDIENSIYLLNNIIREGVFQKNVFVSLAHELHLSKCYLELMRMRFPDVDVTWCEEDSLSQCQVFKFSLQPVLENCFTHAFRKKLDRKKTIRVEIVRKDGDCCIIVSDNGIGFDVNKLTSPTQVLHTRKDTSSMHVGLQNIHKRITEVFGSDYGISIASASPGTIVEIRYPIMNTPPLVPQNIESNSISFRYHEYRKSQERSDKK